MAQPTPYDRGDLNGDTYFTDWNTSHPTQPAPGQKWDQEFNAIQLTLEQTLINLALLQRDDGELANATVGADQLKEELFAGINPPSPWLTATDYAINDSVIHGSGFYRALEAHTSGVFATDLAADKWILLIDLTTLPSALLLTSATATVTKYLINALAQSGLVSITLINGGTASEQVQISVTSPGLSATGATPIVSSTTIAPTTISIFDSTAGSFTLHVQNTGLTDGMICQIYDVGGVCDTNPVVVTGQTKNIVMQGQAAATFFSFNSPFAQAVLTWDASGDRWLGVAYG